MKKIMLGILSVLFAFNCMAQATVKTYTCESIYLQSFLNKEAKQEKYNDRFNEVRGDMSFNSFYSFAGLMAASALTGSAPIILAVTLTPQLISAIKNLPSKEERAIKLADETSKKFKRFVGRMQSGISKDITAEEVENLINQGFVTGKFCDNLPNLASPRDIRKHVLKELKAKYSAKN